MTQKPGGPFQRTMSHLSWVLVLFWEFFECLKCSETFRLSNTPNFFSIGQCWLPMLQCWLYSWGGFSGVIRSSIEVDVGNHGPIQRNFRRYGLNSETPHFWWEIFTSIPRFAYLAVTRIPRLMTITLSISHLEWDIFGYCNNQLASHEHKVSNVKHDLVPCISRCYLLIAVTPPLKRQRIAIEARLVVVGTISVVGRSKVFGGETSLGDANWICCFAVKGHFVRDSTSPYFFLHLKSTFELHS